MQMPRVGDHRRRPCAFSGSNELQISLNQQDELDYFGMNSMSKWSGKLTLFENFNLIQLHFFLKNCPRSAETVNVKDVKFDKNSKKMETPIDQSSPAMDDSTRLVL